MQAPRPKHSPAARIVAPRADRRSSRSASPTSTSARATTPSSVPSGAHAGQLTLHPCHYATEDGSYAPTAARSSCRENRHDPHSRLIALPVTRIHARSAQPGAPIFRLQGGPGITNMSFPDASRFAARHDVVLVGYRGVDGSSRLDCPEVESAREHSRDLLSEQSFRADRRRVQGVRGPASATTASTSPATRCPSASTTSRPPDGARLRRRSTSLSESAGTRTAMIYAWRYPSSIHRSVMIGVNPPGNFLWDAKTTGEQIRKYAALCAANADVPEPHARPRRLDPLGSSSTSRALLVPADQEGQRPGSRLLRPDERDCGRRRAARGADDDRHARSRPQQGDGAGAWFLSLMAELAFPRAQVWGEVAAVGRSDAAYARRFFARHADRGSVIGSPGTDLIWAGGRLVDAWPASPDENQYTRVQDSNVETLLIGGALDFATPPQNATRELLPHLPNGHQVVLPDIGHTDDFWALPARGRRPPDQHVLRHAAASTRRCYTRDVASTSRRPSATARSPRSSSPSCSAFAALTVLSLLWLALRVRRRGRLRAEERCRAACALRRPARARRLVRRRR